MRRLYLLLLVCISFSWSKAYAQSSWAEQLEGLAQWAKAKETTTECEEQCYALSSMTLSGTLATDNVTFTLNGELWTDTTKPQLIPLFGPASSLGVTDVTLNGKPASISFIEDTYYVRVSEKNFTMKGKLSFLDNQSMTIPGPLNHLTSSLTDVTFLNEETSLSALQNATIQFEAINTNPEPEPEPEIIVPEPAPQPPVYQISRAFRVQEELRFEYRVTVQSGQDIGTVHLPLTMKEQVLDVSGTSDWKEQDGGITLVATGRSALFVVTGKLPALTKIEPDARSTFEHWFIERDPTHRVVTKGNAKQLELGDSPFTQTLSSSRLFIAKKGDSLAIDIRALATVEALAAVISDHHRRMIWTKDGDIVFEDRMSYQNGGLEYLPYGTSGTPIYEELDGSPRRLVKDETDPSRLLLAIPSGSHSLRLQSLDFAAPGWLFGALTVPAPSHPFEVSHARVSIDLPEDIYPMYVSERGWVGPGSYLDLVALFGALLFSVFFFQGWQRRGLGFVAVLGVWGVAPALFWPMLIGACTVRLFWWSWGHFSGARRFFVWGVMLTIGLIGAPLLLELDAQNSLDDKKAQTVIVDAVATTEMQFTANGNFNEFTGNKEFNNNSNAPTANPTNQLNNIAFASDRRGGEDLEFASSLANNVTMKAIRPVALPLPSYQKEVTVSKELVTKDRPLTPTMYYVTSWVVWPFFLLWLLAVGATLLFAWPSILLALLQIKKEIERLGEPATK